MLGSSVIRRGLASSQVPLHHLPAIIAVSIETRWRCPSLTSDPFSVSRNSPPLHEAMRQANASYCADRTDSAAWRTASTSLLRSPSPKIANFLIRRSLLASCADYDLTGLLNGHHSAVGDYFIRSAISLGKMSSLKGKTSMRSSLRPRCSSPQCSWASVPVWSQPSSIVAACCSNSTLRVGSQETPSAILVSMQHTIMSLWELVWLVRSQLRGWRWHYQT